MKLQILPPFWEPYITRLNLWLKSSPYNYLTIKNLLLIANWKELWLCEFMVTQKFRVLIMFGELDAAQVRNVFTECIRFISLDCRICHNNDIWHLYTSFVREL